MADLKDDEFWPLTEVARAAGTLSKADLVRLRRAAGYFLHGKRPVDPDDLVNEAVCRTLEPNGRHWSKRLSFPNHLYGVIRSLAGEYFRPRKTQHLSLDAALEGRGGHSDGKVLAVFIDNNTPESEALQHEKEQTEIALRNRIWELFNDDDHVQAVLCGIESGLSREETCAQFEMTLTEYDSARKKLRRHIDNVFPKGLRL